ncbi:hypothetical protein ACIRBX_00825 [Kitasatospora sp. NPDC096147]|uniref:hypothetical protein n=1 Tax=Kitasatospora sp. NPDC096147 TaxID=3364093 RepID=UPI00380F57BB
MPPSPAPLPELPAWPALLREFGRPAAALARPRPDWLAVAGHAGTDGLTYQLDLDYHQDRTLLARVTTFRVPPPHHRVYFTPVPASLLLDFLTETAPTGPGTPSGEPVAGTGWLFVDGSALEGLRLTHGEYVLTVATVATEIVAVASSADLHDEAVHLTLHTPPLPG